LEVEAEIQARYQIAREEEEELSDDDLKFEFLGKDKNEENEKDN